MQTSSPLVRQRLIICSIAIGVIFLPSIVRWTFDPEAVWYRPYLVWLIGIAAPWFIIGSLRRRSDD